MLNAPGIAKYRAMKKSWSEINDPIDRRINLDDLKQDTYKVTITKQDQGPRKLGQALARAGLVPLSRRSTPEIVVWSADGGDTLESRLRMVAGMTPRKMQDEEVYVNLDLLHMEVEYRLTPKVAIQIAKAYLGKLEEDFTFTLRHRDLVDVT